MKRYYNFIASCFLCSCAMVGKDINIIHPNEYNLPPELNGRLYSIDCDGNAFAGSKTVDKKCKKYIAKFAYEKGFYLFSVLHKDGGSSTTTHSQTTNKAITTYSNASVYSKNNYAHGYGSSTTYVPHTEYYDVTTHYKSYIFALIRKTEIKKWKNFYRVFDYYNPNED